MYLDTSLCIQGEHDNKYDQQRSQNKTAAIALEDGGNAEYQNAQNQEIRLGTEQGLDVSVYSNPEFNWLQMKEIRLGLEAGLDVSSYCGLVYSATDMKKKRLDLINGKTTKTTLVNGKETLLNSLRKNEFVISIEDNGNKAYAYIPWIPGNSVSAEDIYNDLRRREIIFGIKHDAITDMITKRRMNEKVLIAEGVPAQKGTDGWFEFFVRLDLPRIPAPLPDGGVDYVNIEAFEMVNTGSHLKNWY